MKNKWSLYAYVVDKWMHVFSWPTKAEAETLRRFYYRHHHKPTKIVPIA